MKKIILTSILLAGILLLAGNTLSAQDIINVSYGYDAAGNRISRTIVLPKNQSKSKSVTDKDKTEAVTESLGEVQLKIYPNPTKGQLGVEISGSAEDISGIVRIYTVQGVLIEERSISATRTDLDISHQPSGTYILKVSVGGKESTWKIIKE